VSIHRAGTGDLSNGVDGTLYQAYTGRRRSWILIPDISGPLLENLVSIALRASSSTAKGGDMRRCVVAVLLTAGMIGGIVTTVAVAVVGLAACAVILPCMHLVMRENGR